MFMFVSPVLSMRVPVPMSMSVMLVRRSSRPWLLIANRRNIVWIVSGFVLIS